MSAALIVAGVVAALLALIVCASLLRCRACTCVTPWPTIRVRTRRGFETRCQVCEGKK